MCIIKFEEMDYFISFMFIIFFSAQLCAKCGHYSGERHKYCLLCVDKMKRNGQVEVRY